MSGFSVNVRCLRKPRIFVNGTDTMSAPWSRWYCEKNAIHLLMVLTLCQLRGREERGGGVVKLKFDNPCIQGLEILSGPCGFLQTDIRVVPMTNY